MKLGKNRAAVMAITWILVMGSAAGNVGYAMERAEQITVHLNSQVISPLWSNINDISAELSARGITLYPEVYVKAKSSSSGISGTMYLEKYTSGRWLKVTSWNFGGTGNVSISKNYTGSSGTKYRVKVVVAVNGENATAYSGSYSL